MIKIIKQKRKTISIKIDEFNNIIVKAPLFLSNNDIQKFINLKESWIKKHLKSNEFLREKYRGVLNKEKALYFGKIIDYTEDFIDKIKAESRVYLPKRVEFLSQKLNLNYSSVKIKNYKTRWGSIDKERNVSLNFKLLMLDVELIDYVIIHELCHTIYFNHKQKFHNLLKNLIENETEVRRKLKEFCFINKLY